MIGQQIEQISFFDEQFGNVFSEDITVKDSYTADELKELELKGHHFYRKYILYKDVIDGVEVPTYWQNSGDLALLKNNTVFYRNGRYAFLKILKNKTSALNSYNEELKRYKMNFSPHESDVERIENEKCEYRAVRINDYSDCYASEDYIEDRKAVIGIIRKAYEDVEKKKEIKLEEKNEQ